MLLAHVTFHNIIFMKQNTYVCTIHNLFTKFLHFETFLFSPPDTRTCIFFYTDMPPSDKKVKNKIHTTLFNLKNFIYEAKLLHAQTHHSLFYYAGPTNKISIAGHQHNPKDQQFLQ